MSSDQLGSVIVLVSVKTIAFPIQSLDPLSGGLLSLFQYCITCGSERQTLSSYVRDDSFIHLELNAEGKRDVRFLFGEVLRKINDREADQLFGFGVKTQNYIIGVLNVV